MRLFIATEFDDVDFLSSIQDRLEGAEFTKPKSFHVTYRFLGEAEPGRLLPKLSDVKAGSFRARMDHIGCFPHEGYVRVIWAGFEDATGFRSLKKKIDSALGFKDEDFTPHVTLARVKRVTDRDALLASMRMGFEPREHEVRSFKLIKSTLSRQGPIYETVEEFTLG